MRRCQLPLVLLPGLTGCGQRAECLAPRPLSPHLQVSGHYLTAVKAPRNVGRITCIELTVDGIPAGIE